MGVPKEDLLGFRDQLPRLRSIGSKRKLWRRQSGETAVQCDPCPFPHQAQSLGPMMVRNEQF
jgi:hypothetical protein